MNLTRQDVQAVIDGCRNQIMQRMALRQDVLIVTDAVKSTQNVNNQTQAMVRQAEAQRAQLNRRLELVENRLVNLEQNAKATYALLAKISDQLSQQQPQVQPQPQPQAQQQPITMPQQPYFDPQNPYGVRTATT